MARKILVLLTLLPLAISCDESDIQPVMDSYRLSKILNYSSSSASLPYSFVAFDYDNRGNLIKESMFDYPGTLLTYTVYDYSDHNKLKRKQTFDGHVGNLTLGGYVSFSYDNGNLTQEEWHRADGTLIYTIHNEFEGNLLKATYKENDELKVHHLTQYAYDDKNRKTSEAVFMYDEALENFSTYFYDTEDRLIKTLSFDRDSILVSRREKVYYGSNNLQDEELYFSPNGELTSRILFEYDSWGNLVGCSIDGTSCHVVTKKYNGNLLLEEIMYHPGFACTEWWVNRYEYELK